MSTNPFNAQENAFKYARGVIFDACGVSIEIKRGGLTIKSARAVLAQTKYEEVDPSAGQAFANFVDVLLYGSVGYIPKTGDIVEIVDTGETFVVRPIASTLWKWDDPYRLVMRFYAQRRAMPEADNDQTETP